MYKNQISQNVRSISTNIIDRKENPIESASYSKTEVWHIPSSILFDFKKVKALVKACDLNQYGM